MFNPNQGLNSPWRYNQPPNQPGQPIVLDSDSDDDHDDHQPEMAGASYSGAERHHGPRQQTYLEQDKKTRSRLREERHAALCVLMDRELLTIQALAAQETLPQTRRRFLSTLLSPSDPITAAVIRADQFTIQRPRPSTSSSSLSSYTEPMVVSRGVVDVCETDDNGWYKPSHSVGTGDTLSGTGPESASSSPVSSAKMKGRTAGTPERNRAGRRVSSGRHQQQQNRERRRRWSGAERQDYGAGASF